jgi:23S rRNA (guanine745-N1)-methyltransferase
MLQLKCPLCNEALNRHAKQLCCSNRHSFDRARQGYFNLLPVQFKRSNQPGDDRQMVAMRQQFLDARHYQSVSEQLNALALKLSEPLRGKSNRKLSIIDIGCGEGYYTERLNRHFQTHGAKSSIAGIDISREAILASCRRSATTNSNIEWLVASNAHLPLPNDSVDLIVSLFTPLQNQELGRTLSTDGKLLIATAGSQHLLELRELLYTQVKTVSYNPCHQLQDLFEPVDFLKLDEKSTVNTRCRYTLTLNNSEQIYALFSMTPHYWRSSPEKKQKIRALEKLTVSIDIHFHCLQKKPTQS